MTTLQNIAAVWGLLAQVADLSLEKNASGRALAKKVRPAATHRFEQADVGQGIRAIVIGAAALAAHRYVRHTEDIDLGVSVAVRDFASLAGRLRTAGLQNKQAQGLAGAGML